MSRIFLCLFVAALAIACNTSSKKADAAKEDSSVITKSHTWTEEEERVFLADCVDKAKAQLGDTLAFAQCNCVLGKLKQNFPTLDSAASTLSDTAKAASFASSCK